jgi:hypothetical protein
MAPAGNLPYAQLVEENAFTPFIRKDIGVAMQISSGSKSWQSVPPLKYSKNWNLERGPTWMPSIHCAHPMII